MLQLRLFSIKFVLQLWWSTKLKLNGLAHHLRKFTISIKFVNGNETHTINKRANLITPAITPLIAIHNFIESFNMEVQQSDQAQPSSLSNSKPCNRCRITEFQKAHKTSPVLQVPLLLQDRQFHKLSTMEERRLIAGLSYGNVLRMVN